MHSLGSSVTSLVILGFFALNAVAIPSPRWRDSFAYTAPSPVSAAPAPAATSSSANSNEQTTTSTDQNTDSDSSSTGSGTSGQALIVNKCSFPTYVYVCIQHPASCGSTQTLDANGGTYSEAYGPASDGGHSLKISVTKGAGDILQFEYTNEGNGDISYDLSEVDGNPFGQWGFSLTNTTRNAYCAPPATSCPAIFTQPTNGIPYTAPTSEGTGAILCG